jgi:cell division protein FtsZ
MIQFDLPSDKSSIIKVIGVGGGGSNAVNYMFNQQTDGVNFIICNTDAQALASSGVPNRIQLGPHLTQGLGAGANPEIGRQATEESLEEIRRILEVNTKMAFITAGMGGGTGTGGAPIMAKICKEMGILTVGIVTTPFAYEGKKRLQQAEEGIRQLRQQVDTLLVISNDKLRHQFGNLKMREAFEKADNVLATAARCITDVINSTGQINVDFADVCTVMRNGGRAILGHAQVAGENRAQLAIEEAINSPLLNDNDIRGAKWILININSSHGEHEFSMDEVEVIQHYLLTQAGENTDVILGMGYDDNLGDKLGITLIATGFDHKDNLSQPVIKKAQPVQEEKIVMVLGESEPAPAAIAPVMPVAAPIQPPVESPIAETHSAEENTSVETINVVLEESNSTPAHLMPTLVEPVEEIATPLVVEDKEEMVHFVLDTPASTAIEMPVTTDVTSSGVVVETDASFMAAAVLPPHATNNSGISSGGYLTRPANIYADSYTEKVTTPVASTPSQAPSPAPVEMETPRQETPRQEEIMPPVVPPPANPVFVEEEETMEMQLVEKEETPAVQTPLLYELHATAPKVIEEASPVDETMEQQRRAAERLQKLRNLSFNVNTADPNNEFETVPAYIRRNMEMYNPKTEIENFYSSYEVKEDPSKQGPISTINSFLEGKKPD